MFVTHLWMKVDNKMNFAIMNMIVFLYTQLISGNNQHKLMAKVPGR